MAVSKSASMVSWAQQQPIAAHLRNALAALAESADHDGVCAATLSSIVHQLDVDPFWAEDIVRDLQAAGLLRVSTATDVEAYALVFDGAAELGPHGAWVRRSRVSFAAQQMVRIAARDEQDGVWRCRYCRIELARVDQPWIRDDRPSPEREHVVPRIRGGSNKIANLALACTGCNSRKGPHLLSELPEGWHLWRECEETTV